MRFTFVHAADLHLDSPVGAVSRVPTPLRGVFGAATFRSFERVVDLCLDRHASFLLLAGDLFDAEDRSVRARLQLRDQLMRLDAASIRTFIVHGNHDPLSGARDTLALPSSVKVFGSVWEEVPLLLGGELACRIQGISYPTERMEENLARRFSRQEDDFSIGLLHANVGANRAHANYAPASYEDLAAASLDYWALGHVHTRAERRLTSGGWAVYPGNTQGRHALEAGPRGCMVVEVDGRHCKTEFVSTDSVRWHEVVIDVGPFRELGALQAEVEARVVGICQGPQEAHAVKVILRGRSALHRELWERDQREPIEAALRETLRARACPAALDGLWAETCPELDLESLRAEGGLSAAVLDLAGAPDASHLMHERDLPALAAALQRHRVPESTEGAARLLERAAHRAVELLAEEGG